MSRRVSGALLGFYLGTALFVREMARKRSGDTYNLKESWTDSLYILRTK